MTDKQKRFCDEYLIDCNATQAAIRAGYSDKTAYAIGEQNLRKLELKNYIQKRMEEHASERVATADEVIQYLTSVLRGDSEGEEIVVEGIGDGCSEARTMKKAPSEKERLKAAELLGKRYGLFKENLDVHAESVVIVDDIQED